MGQLNHSQRNGKTIISDFDETIGGKVVNAKNLDAESSHMDMAGISNLESKSLSEMDVGAASIECDCCYCEFELENMIQCPTGHRFCFSCIGRRIDEIIYGGLKAHGTLSCMAIDYCNESIPLSEIQKALPNDAFERYEDRQAQEAVAEAKIEGLVYCPFCQIPYEVDKCVKVLDCQNLKCLKASCIQCKKLNHLPLRCDDVEKKSENETALRTEVEERMTKAVIRECNICQSELIKIGGCNQVRCRCGNIMCYICRQNVKVSYLDLHYEPHFCQCFIYIAEPAGKRCQNCNRCSSVENEIEENEALAAKEKALKELVEKEPKLLDMEIGPPLKWLSRQQPIELEQEIAPLQLFNELGNQPEPQFFINMAVNPLLPPQEFLRLGDQLENMAITPPLRPSVHFGFGYERANMALHPPLRPPPHLFVGFGYGDQFANTVHAPAQQFFFRHDYQLANMHLHLQVQQGYGHQQRTGALAPRLPPAHFFRFDNGHQPEYRAIPPPLQPPVQQGYGRHLQLQAQQRTGATWLPAPHFFRFDHGHLPQDMVIPPPVRPPVHFFGFGDQPANMALPPPLTPPRFFVHVPGQQFFRHGDQLPEQGYGRQ